MTKCEICGTQTKTRRRTGDVLACKACFDNSARHKLMNAPRVTAEDLEDEIRDAGVVSITFEQVRDGSTINDSWVCKVMTADRILGISCQRVPFEAMADAFYALKDGLRAPDPEPRVRGILEALERDKAK